MPRRKEEERTNALPSPVGDPTVRKSPGPGPSEHRLLRPRPPTTYWMSTVWDSPSPSGRPNSARVRGDVPFDGDRALGPLHRAERGRGDVLLVHVQAPAGVLLGAAVGDDREVEPVDLDTLVTVVFNGHEHASVSTVVGQDAGVELSGLGGQDDLRFLLRFFLGGFGVAPSGPGST